MSEAWFDPLACLLRCTVGLTVASLVAWLALRWFRPSSPAWHRLTWCAVALQGLLWFRAPVELPVLPPVEAAARSEAAALAPEAPQATPTSHADERVAAAPVATRIVEVRGAPSLLPNGSAATVALLATHASASASTSASFATAESAGGRPPAAGQLGGEGAGAAFVATTPAVAIAPSRAIFTWEGARRWALAAWLVGMAATGAAATAGHLLLLWSLRRAWPAPPAFQREWRRLLRCRGVTVRVPLLLHDTLGPLLCFTPRGYFVLAPEAAWRGFTRAQRLAVLEHELAHLQRGDVWKSLLFRLACWPHWFNPCAWWAAARFDEGAEWACDQRLAAADPRQAPVLARALLCLVESAGVKALGVSAARGSFLAARVRRLLLSPGMEDSLMKRWLLIVLALVLTVLGVAQFKLTPRAAFGWFGAPGELLAAEGDADANTAAAAEQAAPPAAETPFAARAAEFARKLQVGNDELLAKFQALASTPAGQVVLQDRAAQWEQSLRDQASEGALDAYLEAHFVAEGDKLRLRPDQADFKKALLDLYAEYQADIGAIAPVTREVAGKLEGSSETTRLLARFLNQEAAPVIIYARDLRGRARPDANWIAERLEEVFARDGQGGYAIPESQRERARELLDQAERRLLAFQRLQEELKTWAADLAEPDDFHKAAKNTLQTSWCAAQGVLDALGDEAGSIDEALDEVFNELEDMTHDTADGLVFDGEGLEAARELFAEVDKQRRLAERARGPLAEFVSRVAEPDALHKAWRAALGTELALAGITRQIDLPDPDLGQSLRAWYDEALETDAAGKLVVKADYEEHVTNQTRDYLQGLREARRKGKALDDLASRLAEPELAPVYASLIGKFAVETSIARALERRAFDGFAAWRDAHFEPSGDGFILKDGADEELQDMLNQAQELSQEANKDDF